MSFYKSFYWVSMSFGLGDTNLISFYVTVWFGLVGKIKTANRNKPCSCVKKWSIYIETKCIFFAVSIWVSLVCDFSVKFVRFAIWRRRRLSQMSSRGNSTS